MKIVVDTNIIFSSILNSNSNIGDLIFNSDNQFEFYSCSYMRYEILKHWAKLKKISKFTESQLQISHQQVLTKLKFIDEGIIPPTIWDYAEKLVQDIDEDDIDFVALTKFLKATLWTGDKILFKGLAQKDFKKIISTSELMILRNQKQFK